MAGDLVVVTGTLGAAAEGLQLLGQGARLDEDGSLAAHGVWTELGGRRRDGLPSRPARPAATPGAGPRPCRARSGARRDRPLGRAVGRPPRDLSRRAGCRRVDRLDRGPGGPARRPARARARGGDALRPGAARRRGLPAPDGGGAGPARRAARAGRDLGPADHGDRPVRRTDRAGGAAAEPGRGAWRSWPLRTIISGAGRCPPRATEGE